MMNNSKIEDLKKTIKDEGSIICIVGPTALGKSDLSQHLASILDGEIISADSMQIYKGMDIGTAKVKDEDRLVKHFGIDIVDPGEPYSASLFQDYSRFCINEIFQSDQIPFLVGGTGFYIRAAIDDYDFPKGEQVNNPIRAKYENILKDNGSDFLWNMLDERDHESAIAIHPNNTVRVIRALEMNDEGISYADQLRNLGNIQQVIPATMIGLYVDRDVLIQRVDSRVDKMRELGLVEEVEKLLDSGFRDALTAKSAIGYKEIVAYFDGLITIDEAFQQIKIATRRYAKRQMTWFRKDKRINWIDATNFELDNLEKKSLELLQEIYLGV